MSDTLDVKIAENPEEAFWKNFKDRCLKDIDTNKREIVINETLVELAEKKLSEVKQNGK